LSGGAKKNTDSEKKENKAVEEKVKETKVELKTEGSK
jgi:hypothetical protein